MDNQLVSVQQLDTCDTSSYLPQRTAYFLHTQSSYEADNSTLMPHTEIAHQNLVSYLHRKTRRSSRGDCNCEANVDGAASHADTFLFSALLKPTHAMSGEQGIQNSARTRSIGIAKQRPSTSLLKPTQKTEYDDWDIYPTSKRSQHAFPSPCERQNPEQ